MLEVYFHILEKGGTIAFRYTDQIPATGDRVSFVNLEPDNYIVLYRRFIYEEQKTKVFVILQIDNGTRANGSSQPVWNISL